MPTGKVKAQKIHDRTREFERDILELIDAEMKALEVIDEEIAA